ncbi:MAG: hypothetical protein N3B14_03555 [Thermoleophilia bacterium]|nr:hypothetical protein [Thermoleophilia bacterium]
MAKTKAFELIPRPVPPQTRSSLYKQIVEEFINGGHESVLVQTDRKASTLVQGLRKVLKAETRSGIKVVQRGQEVYLVRS